MKFLKTSLVIVSSLGLIFLGACSGGNQAANSESATKTEPVAKTATTETSTKTEPVAKPGEAHNRPILKTKQCGRIWRIIKIGCINYG